MLTFQQLMFRLQMPLLLLIPVWVAIGRSFFGAGGWLYIVTMFVLGPALFLALVVLMLVLFTSEARRTKSFSITISVLLAIFYTACFVFGFTLVDGGDTEDSVASALTKVLGAGGADSAITTLSQALSLVSFIVACATLVALFIFGIYDRIKKPSESY